MNCMECGHSVDKHAHWGDCLEKQCSCHNTPDKIRIAWFETELEATQARLALTEAALSATGEYIKLIEGDAMAYAGREVFERVEWGYKRERDAYYAACEALEKVTMK